ncbi:hypothetical protein ABZ401_30200 [Streptomyces sp. NPDC005892]|uniref:hypothetical protein n=1 Tax=Streptomyces sp. NPDC005892 TaxID=3155593 RepID=UPI0033FED6E6
MSRIRQRIVKVFSRKTRVRPVARWLAVAALVVAGVGVSASSAQAASSTTCTGTSAVTYSPALKNTPQTVSWTENDTYACTSTDPTLTSGSSTVNATLPGASCISGGVYPSSTTYTINWNNGQSSTMTGTFTDVTASGIETVTGVGTVTSGQFTGGTATVVWVYLVPNPLLCLTTGITSQSGTALAQILLVP